MVAFQRTDSAVQYAALYGMAEKGKKLSFDNYDESVGMECSTYCRFLAKPVGNFVIKSIYSAYTEVLRNQQRWMIGTKWFTGATVNYAEHILQEENPACRQSFINRKLNRFKVFHGLNWKRKLQQLLPG